MNKQIQLFATEIQRILQQISIVHVIVNTMSSDFYIFFNTQLSDNKALSENKIPLYFLMIAIGSVICGG